MEIQEPEEKQLINFSAQIQEIASANRMEVFTCAEKTDLSPCGIRHGSCIDKNIIEEIIGCKINASKDKNQRSECGCVESVEVGSYNTCLNGCMYCYANDSEKNVSNRVEKYDENAPLLCSRIETGDRVTERKLKSLVNPSKA